MAIVIRSKRLVPSPIVEKAAQARPYSASRARPTEAPDAGFRHAEGVESRLGRFNEAPDAGDGRGSLIESQFTQGRSRS